MRRITPAVLLLVTLAGCGQKGPLYQPGDQDAAERYGREAAPESARDADTPNDAADEEER